MIVNKAEIDFNRDLVNVTYNFRTDSFEDTVINMVTETFATIDALTITSKLFLKQKETDQKYSRLLFQNACDVEKLLKGLGGNFIAKALIQSTRKSVDFELKFPFKKVKYIKMRIG